MARPELLVLDVGTVPGVGQAVNVFRYRDKTVQIVGPFVGTLQLEASLDGQNFLPMGAPVTEPVLLAVTFAVVFLRMRVVQLVSGVPLAFIAGFDVRADH